jgi:hypothetical protein
MLGGVHEDAGSAVSKRLMLAVCRVGSFVLFGNTTEANWIYEKIQRPASYFLVAANLLNWQLRRPRVRGVVALMVEPVLGCNLQCTYCPWTLARARLEGTRPRLMTWDTFRTTIDSAPGTVETVQLCGVGEPTLHPRLCDMIEYIADSGRRPSLFTNATLLRGDLLVNLARTRLAVLNVSVEPDALTFRQYRGVEEQAIRSTVERFVAAKSAITEVKVRVTAHAGNQDRLPAAWDAWRGLAQDIKVVPQFTMGGSHAGFTCMEPWRGNLMVFTDGTVSPCAIDCFQDLLIGAVPEQPLDQIFHGRPYRELLARLASGAAPPRCRCCPEARAAGLPVLIPRIAAGASTRGRGGLNDAGLPRCVAGGGSGAPWRTDPLVSCR